jgi:hypothetical protein
VFGSVLLRKVLGSKRKEAAGDWRKLDDDELCDVYSFQI